MIPIGPLMWEHRLIERLIARTITEERRIKSSGKADPFFIDAVVDFIRTYADHCHHGKEEDILFRELAKKGLSPEHQRIMEELVEEHRQGRELVQRLVEAKDRYTPKDNSALMDIQECLAKLTVFYPRHIEKEDKRFFYPCMEYFSKEEKNAMLEEFWDFDRRLIHERYGKIVDDLEI